MTTTQTEALKLALEALEDIKDDCSGCEFEWSNDYPLQAKAHAAIKEALAQPEQRSVSEHLEPVAWWIPKAEQFCLPSSDGTRPFAKAWEPLYTTPPQRTWVGLSEKEMYKLWLTVDEETDRMAFGKAVEAKLKEKNT